MAVIDHIDGPNRDIYLSADTVGASVHPIDIYKEMRTLRKNDENLRKYDVFLSAFGNVPKGGGKFTERYVRENLGTRIIPYDTSHTLTVIGTIITDDGQEGIDCFDRAPLTSTTIVDINYIPPQVEVIQVSSGSGLSTLEHDKLMTGLDVSIPDKVWDEQVSEHLDTGTTGAQLATASSGGVDYDTLAEAVWDRQLNLHTIDGSAGQLVKETNDIENGDWELANNQMIFKDKLGTELFRVNLFDANESPSMDEVYRRTRA